MENIIIRTAVTDDIAVLRQFEQGVISAERPFDVTLEDDPIQYYDLEAMMASADVEIVVAETAGEIIASGYARIQSARPIFRHSRYAYLGFMYVTPAHREKGINKLIIEKLQQWVRSKDINEMRLEVYYENTGAISAYEKFGFEKQMIEMRKGI